MLTHANPDNRIIYLTFDDGPGEYTLKLLDILDRYDVKATFFTTNKHPQYQYLIAEISRRSHIVALHSYSHDYAVVYASEKAFFEDVDKMNDIIEKQTGKRSRILRFPGGSSNTVSARYSTGIMTALTRDISKKGFIYVDWNVCGEESVSAQSSVEVTSNVIGGIEKHKESIVLLHDDVLSAIEAVEDIIKWGLENEYTFLPLTENSLMVHHKVAN